MVRGSPSLKAFLDGLISPSRSSVAVLLATLAVLFTGSILGVPLLLKTGAAGLLALNRSDHYLYATAQLFRLDELEPSETPIIAILGASVTQSSFGTEQEIFDALQAELGVGLPIYSITSSRQNLLEHSVIFEHLPDDRPVFAVLGIGPTRFTTTVDGYFEAYESERFGRVSHRYDQAIFELGGPVPRRTGFTVIDLPEFYSARYTNPIWNTGRVLFGRSIARNEEQYAGRRLPEAEYQAHSLRVIERYEIPEPVYQDNYDRFRDLIENLAPNVHLVVVEHAIRPGFVTDFLGEARYQAHLQRMRGIVADHDIAYWTLALDAGLTDEVFYDWAHISSSEAQDALRAALAERLSEVIRRSGEI